ncbi:PTS system mannose/fructose/sorbose family transporter subunit IID [Brevibacillus sp. SYP-B805]|uniref:PTS system mannose/fructose/sorbose family transporter subunit IID n=1 Tax=Brevibacillus sp. SYP-B805 TaxID=1578199 RepID=UPI0013EC7E6E|nr:PTS system mannose/fructose/sorbose family transporter subunit IID [Brevibacillus sp. SYP-B805]NGQ95761.1 PTS system mannose/fructose/sorbose family transporter subunit IID [Brevibacillus sp. SYP-B805]
MSNSVTQIQKADTQPYVNPETITKKDIRSVALRWLFFNTSAWNWERMQHIAFAWSLLPVLKKLYKDKKQLGEALSRHMVFFNSEPTIGTPLIGAIAAMEVEKAKGEEIPDDVFNAVKSGLMGPLAALGDSLFASTVNALLLSFGMGLAMEQNLLGPVGFAVVWIMITLGFVLWGTQIGFQKGINLMDTEAFSEKTITTTTNILSILGLTVIGGLSASFVNLTTTVTWSFNDKATELQVILDGLMPKFLPFLLVLALWYLHDRKNVSVMKLLLYLVIFGAVGSLLHVF